MEPLFFHLNICPRLYACYLLSDNYTEKRLHATVYHKNENPNN